LLSRHPRKASRIPSLAVLTNETTALNKSGWKSYKVSSIQSHRLTEEDVVSIAAKAEGYSGADMSNLCKEAAMGPIRSLDYSKIDQVFVS
jgi:SpoVK/Ycf46/Vps4 family AAA+-type ATPase